MKKLLILLLLSNCATMDGAIGHKCLEKVLCERGAICAYDNDRLDWYCVEKEKIKPTE